MHTLPKPGDKDFRDARNYAGRRDTFFCEMHAAPRYALHEIRRDFLISIEAEDGLVGMKMRFIGAKWWLIGSLAVICITTIGLGCGSFFAYSYYRSHFLPQTTIGSLDVSNLTLSEAESGLTGLQIDPDLSFTLSAGDSSQTITASQLQLSWDYQGPLQQASAQQNRLNAWQLLIRAFWQPQPHSYPAQLFYDAGALEKWIMDLAALVYDPGEAATVTYNQETQAVEIAPGRAGFELQFAPTVDLIRRRWPQTTDFTAVTTTIPLALAPEQIATIHAQSEAFVGKTLILDSPLLDDYQYSLSLVEIAPFLNPLADLRTGAYDWLYQDIISFGAIRLAQEPKLIVEENAGEYRVVEFVPPRPGLTLPPDEFTVFLDHQLQNLSRAETKKVAAVLPLRESSPSASLAATNNLGIEEELGFGESYYAHSIPSRIHNVALAASRINNTLVAPGAEFSFNRALGEVSSETGFQEGYVIEGERSVLSDGGGVCQVSTTLFRALLDAGVQITKRLPHSYRVTFYELDNNPGFDATVYAGDVDLRFINDTPGYILINAEADSETLYMTVRLYGTSDGRYSQITDYKKFDYRPPLEDEYFPDDSLAPGHVEQIDWARAGLQTEFTHTIYNGDGSLRSQISYPSVYRAWSNKYLVGPTP
jgi:vancomycin resistance protein YoaR